VFRSFAIDGKPGKYMSIENAPNADNNPSVNMVINLSLPFIKLAKVSVQF
jgi:hypothetical protein